jgi:peptidoglycan/LPS O-acetylase OafA/YrhL
MGGAHRSTTQRPITSALKSAAWLLTVAALIAIPLAALGLVGFIIYFAIAHPADAWPLAVVVQGGLCVALFGHLTWVVIRRRPRSPAQVLHVISEGFLLLCVSFGLFVEGTNQAGWSHGPVRYVITGTGLVLLLAVALYSMTGERRLKAVLLRKALEREIPPP